MIVRLRMSPEKKEKVTKKIDKMMDFLYDLKECFEESEDYDEDDEEWEDSSIKKRSGSTSMKNRYSSLKERMR